MDYCLLEDAFKENTGCKDNFSAEKAKKHERKKIKRRAECFKPVDTEDRPAYEKTNSSISLKELSEAFTDVIPVNMPLIAEINKNSTKASKLPSYFSDNNDDDDYEGFTNSFAPTSTEIGFEKAGGNVLPVPSVDDRWKPITPSLVTTAFFDDLPTPGGTYPIWNKKQSKAIDASGSPVDASGSRVDASGSPVESSDVTLAAQVKVNSELQAKIDELITRLDALEMSKRSTDNNQQEIIAFVGTGVFMIFALHILKH